MQRNATVIDIYAWPVETWARIDLAGFRVEGLDGEIGTIDDATLEFATDAIVVNTGPWIFGRKILLPAGVITGVDEDDRTAFVNVTKDQVKDAPEFSEELWRDPAYRQEVGLHYEGLNRPTGPDFGKDDRPG
jgi:hypothetical protein